MFFDVVKKDITKIKENLVFHGRILFSENGAALGWAASGFTMKFKGRIAVFTFSPFKSNESEMLMSIADGVKAKYSISDGNEQVVVDFEEQGEHELTLLRISSSPAELYVKEVILYGEKVELLTAEKKYNLKMEFLGDSITCGYGVFGIETGHRAFEEDATRTYAYLTAQHFCAEGRFLGWSGRGLYGSCGRETFNRFGDYFTRTIPSSEDNSWDFSCWQPDIFVINGGTNDSGGATHEQFKEKAKELYLFAREKYKNAKIIFMLGAMGNSFHEPLKELCEEINQTDKNYYYLPVKAIWGSDTEIGACSHPSYIGQQRVANELIAFIENII